MKYCSNCAQKLIKEIPKGDNRERFVCPACNEIHYQNPKVVTGCLAIHDDRILLCRRAIHPRKGLWTLPAGFLENSETTAEGAKRETFEEANANIELLHLYTLFNLPHISQIYMFYIGKLSNLDFFPGEESMETSLFSEADIPWKEIAFPVVTSTLEKYFKDLKTGEFAFRETDIFPGK